MVKNRLDYFDGIKGISIIYIYTMHFIAQFSPETLRFWNEFPLKGLVAKLALVMLTVELGFFAYMSGKRNKNPMQYGINRYLYFTISSLLINISFLFAWKCGLYDLPVTLIGVVKSSVLLKSDIFATLWILPYFFMGSIMSYVNGMINTKPMFILIEMLALYITFEDIWVVIALMGNLVFYYIYSSERKITQWYIILGLLLCFFWMQDQESNYLYFKFGVFSSLLMVFVAENVTLQKILSVKLVEKIGKMTMPFFLTHVLIYLIVGSWLIERLPYGHFSLCVVYIICLGLTLTIASIINKPLRDAPKYLTSKIVSLVEKF